MKAIGEKDFFSAYMDYCQIDKSEAPASYHRWVCASILGALKGRSVWLPFGHSVIYPNQYIMLMGSPAAKKGTAINIGRYLLKKAGYARFAPDRTSKEMFLKGMKQFDDSSAEGVEGLEALVWDAPAESYICAGEFVDFIGQGDTGFMMTLTNIWDNPEKYEHPKITGRAVIVEKPTVNLLGGSNASTFALAFPPEAIGTGFMSRLILVHGEGSGNKIAWPAPPDALVGAMLVERMKEMRNVTGELAITSSAYALVAEIYIERVAVDDGRFAHYMERRHIHMLKLASLMAISDIVSTITDIHVLRANTMIAVAETRMPRALGEFGASKYSDQANKILEFLSRKHTPQTTPDLWKAFSRDFNKPSELNDVLLNLKTADKIQVISMKGKMGYMPLLKPVATWKHEYLDMKWLTQQEMIL